MLCRDCVEDEVETAYMLAHLIGVSRNDYIVGAEPKRVFFLVSRSSKDYDMGSKPMSNLYRHMTQPT